MTLFLLASSGYQKMKAKEILEDLYSLWLIKHK